MSITFPTTAAAFIAAQETGAGRPLTNPERSLMEHSVDIMNECFHSGKTGGKMPWPESPEEAVEGLREMGALEKVEKNPFAVRYLAFMLAWTKDAYHQGQEAAQ